MPRMRAVSACADVRCIGFRDSKRRCDRADRDRRQLGLDLLGVETFCEPIWFRCRKTFPVGQRGAAERSLSRWAIGWCG
jgi:hypothetical protein